MNRKEYRLTEDNINAITEEVKTFLTGRKAADRDVLKLGLLTEESLLRWMDRFGRDRMVSVELSGLAVAKVTISIKAEQYNPLAEDEAGSILGSAFLKNLLDAEGSSAAYRYHDGRNEIVALAHRRRRELKIPGGTVTVAVLLAVAAALLTKQTPEATSSFLVNDLAAPLLSKLMNLIVMVMGPLIFISVISGICALNDVATLSSIGIKAIRRFVRLTLLLITWSVVICFFFFGGISGASNGAVDFSAVFAMLLELIPQDPVSPFVETKTIQIVLIAVAIGVALLLLDDKASRLRALVAEANQLIFTVMDFVSRLIPLTVFLSIYKAMSVSNFSGVVSVWKLVASGYVIMVPFTVCMVLYVCWKRKLNVRRFLKDISAPAVVSFTTGSGTLAMMKQFETAREKLKIDEKLVNFWVPLSHAMFSPSVIAPLVAAAFFAGTYYGTPVSLPQLLVLYILVTQLSIASPKIPGGIMATYMILLGQLGMPTDVVGLLMVANVFVMNMEAGLAMVIRSTELVEFSHAVNQDS